MDSRERRDGRRDEGASSLQTNFGQALLTVPPCLTLLSIESIPHRLKYLLADMPSFAYNSTATQSNMIAASQLNNEANMLESIGDYATAETKQLEALRIKIQAVGEDSIQVALTKNALGELYLTTGRLEEAQKMLEEAYKVRSSKLASLAEKLPRTKLMFNAEKWEFDTACTLDNLGRLWEMRGDMVKAREMRRKGEGMICSYFNCPKSSQNLFSQPSDLKACAKCTCVSYCGASCQRADWKRHKKFCKNIAAANSPAA